MNRKNNDKIVAVVQCTVNDLYDNDNPDNYCITALKKSNLFSEIVLAVPKIGDYKKFELLAKKWNVHLYYGSKFNVAERIYLSSKKLHPTIVVRVLLKAFFIDVNLVEKMINLVKEGYDYVVLDNNVNYAVSADVISFNSLEKTVLLLKKLPTNFKSNVYRFSPWIFIQKNKKFKIFELKYRKKWDSKKILFTKNKLKKLMKGEENKQFVMAENPMNKYKYYSKFINKNDVVLDAACGQAGGTFSISKNAKLVYGLDYNPDYIKNAKKNFPSKKLIFLHGTDKILESIPILFDKVISSHTIEHVENDLLFLKRLNKKLKPGGKLILEVPRLYKYPLGVPLYPFHLREYTRKSLESLLKKSGFLIKQSKGGNRHNYVPIENADNVFFYVCVKKSNNRYNTKKSS